MMDTSVPSDIKIRDDQRIHKTCEICGRSCRSVTGRKKHQSKCCPLAKKLTCDVCGRTFKCIGNLLYHYRAHTGEKSFACSLCDKKFSLTTHLYRHLEIHNREEQYTCYICSVRFGRKIDHRKHFDNQLSDSTKPISIKDAQCYNPVIKTGGLEASSESDQQNDNLLLTIQNENVDHKSETMSSVSNSSNENITTVYGQCNTIVKVELMEENTHTDNLTHHNDHQPYVNIHNRQQSSNQEFIQSDPSEGDHNASFIKTESTPVMNPALSELAQQSYDSPSSTAVNDDVHSHIKSSSSEKIAAVHNQCDTIIKVEPMEENRHIHNDTFCSDEHQLYVNSCSQEQTSNESNQEFILSDPCEAYDASFIKTESQTPVMNPALSKLTPQSYDSPLSTVMNDGVSSQINSSLNKRIATVHNHCHINIKVEANGENRHMDDTTLHCDELQPYMDSCNQEQISNESNQEFILSDPCEGYHNASFIKSESQNQVINDNCNSSTKEIIATVHNQCNSDIKVEPMEELPHLPDEILTEFNDEKVEQIGDEMNTVVCNEEKSTSSTSFKYILPKTLEAGYTYVACCEKFISKEYLVDHQRTHYACECGRSFDSLPGFKRHQGTIGPVQNHLKCNDCGKTFQFISALLNHRHVNTDEKLFTCQLCAKKFPLMSHLHRHLKSHISEKRYSCDICGISFGHKGELFRHWKEHPEGTKCVGSKSGLKLTEEVKT